MRELTPRDEQILQALAQDGVVFGRDDLLCVRAQGPDTAKFLHNMLTQDVRGLPVPSAAPTCLCDAQGAIVALAELVRTEGGVDLWTERADAPQLLESLDRYIIMDDVLVELDDQRTLVSLVGPAAQQLAAELGDPGPGEVVAWQDALVWRPVRGDLGWLGGIAGEAPPAELTLCVARDRLEPLVAVLLGRGAHIGSHSAWEAFRLARGLVRLGSDIRDGSLPLEVGLRHSVNYKKGCYVGQEAIAMMTYRGQIRRHLSWIRPEIGQQLPTGWCDAGWTLRTLEGKKAGVTGSQLATSAGPAGLAMIQRKAYAEGATLLAEGPSGEQVRVQVVGTTVPGALAVQKADAPDIG